MSKTISHFPDPNKNARLILEPGVSFNVKMPVWCAKCGGFADGAFQLLVHEGRLILQQVVVTADISDRAGIMTPDRAGEES